MGKGYIYFQEDLGSHPQSANCQSPSSLAILSGRVVGKVLKSWDSTFTPSGVSRLALFPADRQPETERALESLGNYHNVV